MNPGKLVVGTAALLTLGLAFPARAQINGFGGTNWILNNDPASQSVPTIANNILQLANNTNTATSANQTRFRITTVTKSGSPSLRLEPTPPWLVPSP